MLKRINWKLVFYVFLWIISLSGLIVLMSFISLKKQDMKCTELKIRIPGMQRFIERSEVDRILLENHGQLKGSLLSTINIQKLEKALRANPFIAGATIYADMNGVVYIDIRQREPLLRIINITGQDYYIDHTGLKIPVSANFTARVLAANGNITEDFSGRIDTLHTPLARDLYATALFIEKDSLWNDQFEQLFVNTQGDIELIPRAGNHRIILGNADSLESKFRNLRVFYQKALPVVGWDTYKTINIKFSNQVVAEKNTLGDSKTDSLTNAQDSLKSVPDTTKIIKKNPSQIKTLIH